MTLTLTNTYTKRREPFVPLDPEGRTVTMYTCGPTVYSYAHIGNFRTFLFADVLRRVLERRGHRVRQVMNVTDVGHMTEDHLADATGEDKLARAARELGADPFVVARHFERAFVEDARRIGLAVYRGADADDPALHPRATEHVPEMLEMIQRLIARGYAYCDGRGQVYFEVARFPEYGRLSGKDLDELEAGARVAVREEKRDPRDFALWKVDDKHLMKWDPHAPDGWRADDWARLQRLVPGGVDPRIRAGFPGWHIECSAMARAHLGDVIDLHTGGEDNVFPHHECEIAQSFGALGTSVEAPAGAPDAGQRRPTFARHWVHARHLLVDGHKMSKRDGTFFTVRELLDPRAAGRPELAETLTEAGFATGRVSAPVLRWALVSVPYGQPMSFGTDLLVQARANVERVQSRWDRLVEIAAGPPGSPTDEVETIVATAEAAFDAALDDDLNTPRAIAAVLALVGALNQREAALSGADAARALAALGGFDDVLGGLDRTARTGLVPTAVLEGEPPPEADAGEHISETGIVRLLVARQAARAARDFARADAVREELRTRGVVIEDTPQGVRWKRA